MVEVKELVVTDLTRRGTGQSEWSPVRTILEIYTKEGGLLATHDSQGNYSIEELVSFATLCRQYPERAFKELLNEFKP